MPTINAFYRDEETASKLEKLTDDLKQHTADQLTCGNIKLSSDEVSVRLLQNNPPFPKSYLSLQKTPRL
jgi:hypothetical protein